MPSEWLPVFDDVMAVGRHGLTEELRSLLDGRSGVSQRTAKSWQDLVESLSEADCWDLIRGFVTLEEHLSWPSGSVAAGNLLARAFVHRFRHRWSECVVWLRENVKVNSWYFTKHSPLSFDNYEEWCRFAEAEKLRTR